MENSLWMTSNFRANKNDIKYHSKMELHLFTQKNKEK